MLSVSMSETLAGMETLMSRGPGRIERTIRALMAANPDLAFTTDWLCCHLFVRYRIEAKHRVSVLRAIRRIIAADPDWSTTRWHRSVLFNRGDLQSYQTAHFMARGYPPWPKTHWRLKGEAPDRWPLAEVRQRARAKIAERPDVAEPVRVSWERHCAKRCGDHARVVEIDKQRETEWRLKQLQIGRLGTAVR